MVSVTQAKNKGKKKNLRNGGSSYLLKLSANR